MMLRILTTGSAALILAILATAFGLTTQGPLPTLAAASRATPAEPTNNRPAPATRSRPTPAEPTNNARRPNQTKARPADQTRPMPKAKGKKAMKAKSEGPQTHTLPGGIICTEAGTKDGVKATLDCRPAPKKK